MLYRAAIFDWDGTLVDSVDHIAESLQLASRELSFPERSLDDMRNIVGLGMIEALQKLYPGITEQEILTLRKAYGNHFFSRETRPEHVFDGAFDMLGTLQSGGSKLAVATGKSRPGLDRGLQSSGIGHYFELTRCADETASKPDPTMLKEIMTAWRMDAEKAVMVGDTVYDLEMAYRIGMPAIGVTWGAHDRKALEVWKPIAVVDQMQDLVALLANEPGSA